MNYAELQEVLGYNYPSVYFIKGILKSGLPTPLSQMYTTPSTSPVVICLNLNDESMLGGDGEFASLEGGVET
jgi:hypothetical protein